MRVYAPSFFADFRCTASDCKDNCCRAGWDIEIDQSTYDYYKTLGNGMCGHITDEDGEHYIKQQGGQCPFLDENGLCSVVLGYGEEHISEICTQHPRFYQWFGSYKEAGTGLCCEESARQWLTCKDGITFSDSFTDEPDDDLDFDPGLLSAVLAARKTLINLLQSSELTLEQKLKALLIFGLNTQDFTDDDAAQGFSELAQAFSDTDSVKSLVSELGRASSREDRLCACEQLTQYLQGLDYMKDKLPSMLESLKSRLPQLMQSAEQPESSCPEAEKQLCNIAVYNVYRYFIECARGAEALPRLVFCILNVQFVKLWYTLLLKDGQFSLDAQIDAVKEFSQEIEYSDNMETVFEDVYTDDRLCAANLVKITEV